jgi:hypothetical protein
MKITMKDIREMILREVNETLSPLDFSQGRDPAVSGTPDMFTADTDDVGQKAERPTHISISELVATLKDLGPDGGAIMNMLFRTLQKRPREDKSAELIELAGALADALGDYKGNQ